MRPIGTVMDEIRFSSFFYLFYFFQDFGYIKTLNEFERVIDFQVDRQPTTVFEFVDNCESSAWVCDYCGGGIKGQESPESLGYNRCPFCGLLIEVGK